MTARGLLVSTAMVVFAASFQTWTVGITVASLVDGATAPVLVIAVTAMVAALLVWYALVTLFERLRVGAPDQSLPSIPSDATVAWTANEPWQKTIVLHRLRKLYEPWLDDPARPGTAPKSVPTERFSYRFSDLRRLDAGDVPAKRMSMI